MKSLPTPCACLQIWNKFRGAGIVKAARAVRNMGGIPRCFLASVITLRHARHSHENKYTHTRAACAPRQANNALIEAFFQHHFFPPAAAIFYVKKLLAGSSLLFILNFFLTSVHLS
jgi:hypothetical protein